MIIPKPKPVDSTAAIVADEIDKINEIKQNIQSKIDEGDEVPSWHPKF